MRVNNNDKYFGGTRGQALTLASTAGQERQSNRCCRRRLVTHLNPSNTPHRLTTTTDLVHHPSAPWLSKLIKSVTITINQQNRSRQCTQVTNSTQTQRGTTCLRTAVSAHRKLRHEGSFVWGETNADVAWISSPQQVKTPLNVASKDRYDVSDRPAQIRIEQSTTTT